TTRKRDSSALEIATSQSNLSLKRRMPRLLHFAGGFSQPPLGGQMLAGEIDPSSTNLRDAAQKLGESRMGFSACGRQNCDDARGRPDVDQRLRVLRPFDCQFR